MLAMQTLTERMISAAVEVDRLERLAAHVPAFESDDPRHVPGICLTCREIAATRAQVAR